MARTRLWALALVGGLALAGAGPAGAEEYRIVLDKMAFGPVPAEVHPGDTVVWENRDIFQHTATARDKSFDIDLPPKSEASMTVGAAGTVDFYCRFHPGMTGTLVITP
jgi:plastocyanin